MGNLGSVANMLKKVGGACEIAATYTQVANASKILLPGVGRFDAAMSRLEELGWANVLREKARTGTPILGICLGMQLLAEHSEEGNAAGLGLIPGEVRRFRFDGQAQLRVPHMGWNRVHICKRHPLVNSLDQTAKFYFVHSYYFECREQRDHLLTTPYGQHFTSAVQRENIMGVQFHPEKSHRYGMLLLKNFVEL
jgi:glutamine amidotransferase